MRKTSKNEIGITLIALVITIVILLILAGVSIAMLTGQNGVLNQATQARYKTDEAQEKEGVKLAVISSKMEDASTLEINQTNLEKALKAQFGENSNFVVIDNGDGSFTVKFIDTNRLYYIDNEGNIENENTNYVAISTLDDLKEFRDKVNGGDNFSGKYVYLTNDIEINENWTPIGIYLGSTLTDEKNTYFSGTFDGKKHEISKLNISSTDRGIGLFGIVNNGTIQNLRIVDSEFIVNYNAGGIAGYLYNNSKIINCSANIDINVRGDKLINIGGLVGNALSDCQILSSVNLSNIKADEGATQVGGIAGAYTSSFIESCYNVGNIKGTSLIGGVVGSFNRSTMKNCYNIGTIIGNTSIGSIVGKISGTRLFENVFYLEGTVNSEEETIELNGITEKNSEALKKCYFDLGNTFKEDTGINNGYPILSWQ